MILHYSTRIFQDFFIYFLVYVQIFTDTDVKSSFFHYEKRKYLTAMCKRNIINCIFLFCMHVNAAIKNRLVTSFTCGIFSGFLLS